TMEHTERVARAAVSIGRALSMPEMDLRALHKGAMLHDIGKIGLPDAILRKPGSLNDEEWKRMKMHPLIGVQITTSLQSLGEAVNVIRHHHERWDGKGYPDGLANEHIPLLARIASIADAFDAITTDRPYHRGKSVSEARFLLEIGAGSSWDPKLVAIALKELPQG
ncbi:MAG: HD domain-containing protein, partial [Chloroflexi bacterium]|nr:HD domain-containing protein [Chloroflexota bacterium]